LNPKPPKYEPDVLPILPSIFDVSKEIEKFLIQIIYLGGVFASMKAFVPVCAVCISTHKHSVPQSLLSIRKLSEAVNRYALLAPKRIFLSKELEVIFNDNILTWFNVLVFSKIVMITNDNYVW
jgi:hypothetical protein